MKIDENQTYPFKGCSYPLPNSEFCLLVEYKRGSNERRDYLLAKNSEVERYLSGIFGNVGDISSFIDSMDGSDVERILSRHNALNGEGVEAAVYLCDIGPGGGIKKVYAGTKRFRY
ncbi:MAG: hypothetical protein QXN71_02405 [Candidatus Aenigmatarchaeota archaeon]